MKLELCLGLVVQCQVFIGLLLKSIMWSFFHGLEVCQDAIEERFDFSL